MSRYGYHIIKKVLENNMDLVEKIPFDSSENPSQNHITPHQNIRGAEAFS